jgi:hypothetical protein
MLQIQASPCGHDAAATSQPAAALASQQIRLLQIGGLSCRLAVGARTRMLGNCRSLRWDLRSAPSLAQPTRTDQPNETPQGQPNPPAGSSQPATSNPPSTSNPSDQKLEPVVVEKPAVQPRRTVPVANPAPARTQPVAVPNRNPSARPVRNGGRARRERRVLRLLVAASPRVASPRAPKRSPKPAMDR